jgi:hypothetical protein
MFYSDSHNIRFRNLKQNLCAIRLCYELPSNMCYLDSLLNSLRAFYDTCRYAHVWFGYIHNYHQTLSTLAQRCFQKTPFHTPFNFNLRPNLILLRYTNIVNRLNRIYVHGVCGKIIAWLWQPLSLALLLWWWLS